ncbi:alpha/beta fold hydrolase [Microbacterium sp.]|uniref:alpha/beta fold hydrolase n=1 Tax=Microbacterium sp. TaxID=51671 RepID=UPI0028123B23|nr:alpha/beta fold hydrolase [Microbacterium sp.]
MTPFSSVDAVDRHDAFPSTPNGTAALLLAGSSGRIEVERAELLASHGARVRAIRWFGGSGQRPAPHEVPLELFSHQLDELRGDADRIVVFGTSFGAEAALATAAMTPVDAVIAVAPSSVVWAGTLDGAWSSHWTLRSEAIPFVPFLRGWSPETDPPAFRSLYERSLHADAEAAAAARIPVERITAEVLLVFGGDDQVWPSDVFAADIVRTREKHSLATVVVSHPTAGHRMLLPGETPSTAGVRMARGGSPDADAELGRLAWTQISRLLRLHTS